MAEQSPVRKKSGFINLIDQMLKGGVKKIDDGIRSIAGVDRSKDKTTRK